jgi:hypothetical protein
MVGRTKRFFGIDDPRFVTQRSEQERKGSTIRQGSGLYGEEQFILIKSLFEEVEKLASKDDAQGRNREQEVFAGGDPTVLIDRQSSCGDQTMEMKMIQEGLVPGMQHRGQAQGSPKVSARKF